MAAPVFFDLICRHLARLDNGWLRLPPKEPCRFVGWMQRLDQGKESLQLLIGNMETEFLELGRSLQIMAGNATKIQKECAALTDLTEGREEDAAVQFAFQLLKKAEDLILATDEQYDHVFAGFNQLHESLRVISRRYDQMIQTLLPLSFITTQLRIQSSHHDADVQAVFSTLADEISLLVTQVRTALEGQFEDLAATQTRTRKVLNDLTESVAQQKKCVEITWGASRTHLRQLSEALASSGTIVADLASVNRTITGHIGNVIMAQQYQDITRQKIEHIGEAMDQMSMQLETARDGQAGSGCRAEACHFVAKAGAIQLKQVEGVFAELNKAAHDIVEGISGILKNSETAAQSAIAVGDTVLSAGVVQQCKDSVSRILISIRVPVENISGIIETIAPLQSKLNNCTTKAGDLALSVRFFSLNAQIFAAAVPSGWALDVLAHRMQVISDEMILEVRRMSDDIDNLGATLMNLEDRLVDFQELGQHEVNLLATESTFSHNKLGSFENLLPEHIERLKGLQSSFSETASGMVSRVQFPKIIAKASPHSVDMLRDLTEWAEAQDKQGMVASGLSSQVDLLKQGYTMQSERDLHDAALSQATEAQTIKEDDIFELFEAATPALPAETNSPRPDPATDSFGDFELFDVDPSPGLLIVPVVDAVGVLPAGEMPPDVKKQEDLGDNVELF